MAWITVLFFTLRTVSFLLSLAYNLNKLMIYCRVEACYKYHSKILFFCFLPFLKHASSTSKLAHMVGKGLEQHLTINLPTVIIQQLAKEDNLPISRGTGGSEGWKTGHPRQQPLGHFREMVPKELLLPRSLRSLANGSHSWLEEAVTLRKFVLSWLLITK